MERGAAGGSLYRQGSGWRGMGGDDTARESTTTCCVSIREEGQPEHANGTDGPIHERRKGEKVDK